MCRVRHTWWVIVCVASLSTHSVSVHAAVDPQPRPTLDWQPTIEDAKRLASQSNRLVLLHFSSPGCEACQTLEREVFTNPRVQQQIQTRFVPFKINTDDHPTTAKRHNIDRIPMHLVIDPGAKSVILGRMQCPTTVDAYLNELANIVPTPHAVASTAAPVAGTATTVASPAATSATVAANQPLPAGRSAMDTSIQQGANSAAPASTTGSAGEVVNTWPSQSPQAPLTGNAARQPLPDDRYADIYRQMGAAPAPTQPASTIVQPPNANQQTSNSVVAPSAATVAAAQPTWGTAGYLTGQPTGGNLVVSPPATQAATTAPSPLGLEGYCPVTLAEKKVWQVGDRRWGAIHRGRTYLFAGPMEQKQFLANPDRFSPAISGWDVVAALDHGQTIDGQRQFGVTYQDRIYLFSSTASRQAFQQNPTRYAAEVRQAENPTRSTTLR